MEPDGFIDLLVQLASTLDIVWRKPAAGSSNVNSDQFGRSFPSGGRFRTVTIALCRLISCEGR